MLVLAHECSAAKSPPGRTTRRVDAMSWSLSAVDARVPVVEFIDWPRVYLIGLSNHGSMSTRETNAGEAKDAEDIVEKKKKHEKK